MPWVERPTDRHGKSWSYYTHMMLHSDDADLGDNLLGIRKLAQRFREEMLGFQKLCEKNRDIPLARFFRDQASEAMKHYRAACLVIPNFVSHPPGDCAIGVQLPKELAPYLDDVLNWADIQSNPYRSVA